MNKIYALLPVTLMIAFSVYYYQVAKPQMAAAEKAKQEAVAAAQAAEDARRAAIEKKAAADARKQQMEREAKDRARKEKLKRQHEQQVEDVQNDINKLSDQAAHLKKEISEYQTNLKKLREKRSQLNRAMFNDAAKVELARIDRRNSELQIQRMYEMVAERVDNSYLAAMPPPPVEKK